MLTDKEVRQATSWYQDARRFTRQVAKNSGLDRYQVAAILSALSPANNWENNKTECMILCDFINRSYSLDDILREYRFRTYKNMVKKAYELAKYQDPAIHLMILNGQKIKAFYLNTTGLDEYQVTIDRHMIRFYLGDYESNFKDIPNLTKPIIRDIRRIVRHKADCVNLKPCQVQSLIWHEVIRQLNENKQLKKKVS